MVLLSLTLGLGGQGLALAMLLRAVVVLVASTLTVHLRYVRLQLAALGRSWGKTWLATAAMVAALLAAKRLLEGRAPLFVALGASVIVGMLTYLACLYLMRHPEFAPLYQMISAKAKTLGRASGRGR